jgi:hypothetical protein
MQFDFYIKNRYYLFKFIHDHQLMQQSLTLVYDAIMRCKKYDRTQILYGTNKSFLRIQL